MKYFGTDGIRGLINTELNKNIIIKVAKAIVRYYDKYNLKRILLVGNDSRISSDYILSTMETILLKSNIEVHYLGICSSPALAFLTKEYNYPLGMMLSASHNPSEYNGIKFFNNLSEKVSDTFEEEFEYLMDKKSRVKTRNFSKRTSVDKLKQTYINYLRKIKKFNFPIILDCANGGTSEISKSIFPRQERINHKPNGININQNAGCTHIEVLQKLCIKRKKIGFSFDGDGDRIHIISPTGEIINGDKILYILSNFMLSSNDSVVGTIYTNSALEKKLSTKNIKLIRAYVGDKNVYKEMTDHNAIIGGEESGHIIIKPYLNTGDGMLTAIIIGNILALSNLTLDELLYGYQEYHQLRKNIKTSSSFSLSQETLDYIASQESLGTRIIIRPSGTEPVIRIFVEDKLYDTALAIVNKLENLIKSNS